MHATSASLYVYVWDATPTYKLKKREPSHCVFCRAAIQVVQRPIRHRRSGDKRTVTCTNEFTSKPACLSWRPACGSALPRLKPHPSCVSTYLANLHAYHSFSSGNGYPHNSRTSNACMLRTLLGQGGMSIPHTHVYSTDTRRCRPARHAVTSGQLALVFIVCPYRCTYGISCQACPQTF